MTNDNPALFTTAPALAPDGTLSFETVPDAYGAATLTVTAVDNGGTANGGVDTSPPQNFVLTVDPVNDAPTFAAGADPTSNEDAGAQSVVGWTTAISPGPTNEASQSVSFTVINNNASLFTVAPSLAADGTLTYTSAPNAFGSATLTITAVDDGGTASGGNDTSPTQNVTLTVDPVNDAPNVTNPGPQFGYESSPFSLQIVATDIELHNLAYLAVGLPAGLTINGTGLISGSPDPGTQGSYSVDVTVTDDGVPPEATMITFPLDIDFVDADASGPYAIVEGDTLVLDGSASAGPPTSWNWDLDNDGQYDDASGVSPSVPWATLVALGVDDDGVYPIALEVEGGVDTATTSLTIANKVPVLNTTGAATVSTGVLYTLNLAAVDPGNDTVSSWTINWGDGTIDSIVGNPPSVAHTYTREGFTHNILASASDEDGTFLQNELLVPSFDGDKVFRFEETTGAFLQQFAAAVDPIEARIGPDGRLYVSGEQSDNVLRYNAETGTFIDEFVAAGSGGLDGAEGLASGPDGHLYVSDWAGNQVLRFNGTTGAFIDVFANTGLTRPYNLLFGPDANLYVGNYNTHEVVRFDGTSGAFIDVFVTAGSGGLDTPEQMAFGPDGNLYVASFNSNEVLRYNGTTGAFIDVFVAAGGVGDLDSPAGLAFGPDGHLYVGDHADDVILRYDRATGAFIDEYVAPASGGLTKPDPMTFLPKQRVTTTP